MVVPTAYQMEYLNSNQTTHFSPVELRPACAARLLWRGVLCRGSIGSWWAPVDIAATFASILGVNAPSASVGSNTDRGAASVGSWNKGAH